MLNIMQLGEYAILPLRHNLCSMNSSATHELPSFAPANDGGESLCSTTIFPHDYVEDPFRIATGPNPLFTPDQQLAFLLARLLLKYWWHAHPVRTIQNHANGFDTSQRLAS